VSKAAASPLAYASIRSSSGKSLGIRGILTPPCTRLDVHRG
jgi:hypothetical protein